MAVLDPEALATLSEEEIARTLRMDVSGIENTIAQNPSSTIEPANRSEVDTHGRQAVVDLGEQRNEQGIAKGLALGDTIGEGGMGIVRSATQRSLGRRVAVKTLKANVKSDQATLRLLREAWVTGGLEHPNIVPIYDLGLSDDGSPIIVMKHIEGAEWSSLIRDAAAMRERLGENDLLEHNLRILIGICNAVSLAHDKGILHRDLKPENVMIGSFGEAYLVDWGIAVSLRDDPTGRLPLASEAKEIAGTPCYMAPEMMGAVGALSERTDVYLLGAMLHEVLTGDAPHRGTFKQIVASILLSTFQYGADVPPELGHIAKKAMSREPGDRYASAADLKIELEWYLRHRSALALSSEAARRFEQMLAIIEAPQEPDSRERIYRLYAEARFGFRQAMDACEDHTLAIDGQKRAIEAIVSYELTHGTADGAAAALAELDDAPAALRKQVEEALARRDVDRKRIARLEKMEADFDPAIGRRTRVAVSTFLGVVWSLAPQAAAWLERRDPGGHVSANMMYFWSGGLVALCGLVYLWGRESMSKTAINRSMIAIGMMSFALQLLLEVGTNIIGLPWRTSLVLHFSVWAGIGVGLAVFLDRRFFPTAIGYCAGFLLAAKMPQHLWHWVSLANVVLTANVVLLWGSLQDKPRKLEAWLEHRRRQR